MSISQKDFQFCQKELNITDTMLHRIFNGPKRAYNEEFCVRKCLYQRMGLVTMDNKINYDTIDHLYHYQNLKLDKSFNKTCETFGAQFQPDLCRVLTFQILCLVSEPEITIN